MGLLKKKIRKEKKLEKYLKKKKEEGVIEDEKAPTLLPSINIFEVENYNSGIKTVVNVSNIEGIANNNGLSDQTSGMFGGNLNLEKFGEKPLKIIDAT
jgi:hypothetical protein